jgi:hypothetical protein
MKFSRIFVQNSGTAFEDDGIDDLTTITDQSVQLVNRGDNTPSSGSAPGETIDVSADVGNSLDVTSYDEVALVFRDSTAGDSGLVETSPQIPTAELEMSYLAHADPSQQTVEVEMPSSPAVDDMWTIKITNLEQGHQPFPRRSYEVAALASDSSQDIAQKFADQINNAEDSINDWEGASVTASASGGTLTLTADDVGDIFDVATRNFDASSINTTSRPDDGVGTPAQIREFERKDNGTLGRYVQSTNLLGSLPGPEEYVQSNGEYNLLTFQFPGDSEQAVNKTIARQHYVVALEAAVVGNATESAGDGGTDDFEEFFDPVIIASG